MNTRLVYIDEKGDIWTGEYDYSHLTEAISAAVENVFIGGAAGVRVEFNGYKRAFVCRKDNGDISIKNFQCPDETKICTVKI